MYNRGNESPVLEKLRGNPSNEEEKETSLLHRTLPWSFLLALCTRNSPCSLSQLNCSDSLCKVKAINSFSKIFLNRRDLYDHQGLGIPSCNTIVTRSVSSQKCTLTLTRNANSNSQLKCVPTSLLGRSSKDDVDRSEHSI